MALPKRDNSDHATAVRSRIPTFLNVEEAAEFFDTHDMGDYEEDWEQVDDVRFEPAQPANGVWLRLDEETPAALTKLARERRTSPATLARRWVQDRLREQLQDNPPD